MESPQPIYIVDLMPRIDTLLIGLLESLSLSEWDKQTIAPKWSIKDVAVHLLDGNLRTLSMLRDKYYGEKAEKIDSYQDMVAYLNRLNAEWVIATKRLSPKVIIELLKSSGREYCDYLVTLNPKEKAEFSVGWAGENESINWFHIAREYTEKWHHQQQIRHAIGEHIIWRKEKYCFPCLNTSVRGLPHHYRNVKGKKGDLIKFIFRGNTDKIWFLNYEHEWRLHTSMKQEPSCEVIIQDEFAWRIFTKGIYKDEAIQKSEINGNQEIGLQFFDVVAIMA